MIGLIKLLEMRTSLSDDSTLAQVAMEVEAATIRMVDEAK